MFDDATVPEPEVTTHVIAGELGCVRTVTEYDSPVAKDVANENAPFPEILKLSPPLFCSTKPEPANPDTVPEIEYSGKANVAVTVVSSVIVKTHVLVPEQSPPDHPVNVEPSVEEAVNVISVILSNDAVQVEPQSIPAGELVTTPEPSPSNSTVRVFVINSKLAITTVSAVTFTTHAPVPEHAPPDHPVNVALGATTTAKDTEVPSAKSASQFSEQEIPAGVLVINPSPEPVKLTLKVYTLGSGSEL